MDKEILDWLEYWRSTPTVTYNKHVDLVTKNEDNKLIFKLALPGVDKENLELKYEKNVLTISHREVSDFVDTFSYSYTLNDYDFKTLKSNLANGVLTLELSKKEEVKPVIVKLE